MHLCLLEVVQSIIGLTCLSFELALDSINRVDLSRFFIIVWARHPDLIPNEVGCIVPELEEQLAGLPLLFIRAEEIIHSKQDMLQFSMFVHVLEVHDFSIPKDSDDDRPEQSSSSDDGDDGYPGHYASHGLLWPWPRIFRLAGDANDSGQPLPSLPR
jgi:hypothetical protein